MVKDTYKNKDVMNNILKDCVKNVVLVSLLLIFGVNVYECKKQGQNINDKITISDDYLELNLEKIKINENEKNIIYELRSSVLKNVFINLDLEKESAILKIEDQEILIGLNFTYDINIEDAIQEIKILKNKNGNIIFLFPTATEEYLTFQILKYDQQNKIFSDDHFYFETHDDIRNLYLNSKASLFEKNNSYLLKIGTFQFKGAFQMINTFKNEKWDGVYYYNPYKRCDSIGNYYIDIKSGHSDFGFSGNSSFSFDITYKEINDSLHLYRADDSKEIGKIFEDKNQFWIESNLVENKEEATKTNIFPLKYAKSADDIE